MKSNVVVGRQINRRGVGGRVDRIQTMPWGCKDVHPGMGFAHH